MELHFISLISIAFDKILFANYAMNMLRSFRVFESSVLSKINVQLKKINENFEQDHKLKISGH